ncbi:MAG: hypothetical protein ACRDUA_14475 [Micromonosporaceae bacterium]
MRRADGVGGADYSAPRLLEPGVVSVADMPSLPVEISDPLLWRSAQPVLARHPATVPGELCPGCGAVSPCVPRWLAERAIAVAQEFAAGPAIGNGRVARPASNFGVAPPVRGIGVASPVNGATGPASVQPAAREGARSRRRRPSPRPRTVSA